MFGKLEIKGYIEVKTGMHIGGSTTFSAIGSIDSPVIRDAVSDLPIIPGSSLKGKLRTLLAKKYNNDYLTTHDNDTLEIKRLFGSAKKNEIKNSRLIFNDLIADNLEDIKAIGINSLTETKFENTINRKTAVANPRQMERVIRGTRFPLSIIYNIDNEDEVISDITLLSEGLQFLTYDYLGGSGSRGYGKVVFQNLDIDVVIGELDEEILATCKEELAKV